jgi:hypothetical protein
MLYPVLQRISNALISLGAALCRSACVPVVAWDSRALSSEIVNLRASNTSLLADAAVRARSADAVLLRAEYSWRRF